jgi:hypothetical protein
MKDLALCRWQVCFFDQYLTELCISDNILVVAVGLQCRRIPSLKIYPDHFPRGYVALHAPAHKLAYQCRPFPLRVQEAQGACGNDKRLSCAKCISGAAVNRSPATLLRLSEPSHWLMGLPKSVLQHELL